MESIILWTAISGTVALWTNILITIGLIVGSSFVTIVLADRLRQLVFRTGMDAIQLYASTIQARVDSARKQNQLLVEVQTRQIEVSERRRQLLDRNDE